MTFLKGLSADHPTVILPPSAASDFQGWGVRIG